MKSETLSVLDEDDIEIGTLGTLPSAISFCLENNKPLTEYDRNVYGENATLKVGDLSFVKDAP